VSDGGGVHPFVDTPRIRAVVVVHRRGTELTRWSVAVDRRPDLEIVDELARAVLAARRAGDSVEVLLYCPTLREVVHLAGLTNVLAR
jgi:hypothetical protein